MRAFWKSCLVFFLVGCRQVTPLPDGGMIQPDLATTAGADLSTADLPFIMGQCPPPPIVRPADVPATGFLPVRQVDLLYPIDGDTVHFNWVGEGEHSVRFLQINTEESHGAETTAFGVTSAAAVEAMMQGPHLFQVAIKAKTNAPTEPSPDAFGRWLGLVFMDGELLQTRIIREGWSAYYVDFGCAPEPMHTSMLYAEAEANANKRGIWAPGHPTNYEQKFQEWIGTKTCRPNPFTNEKYCN